MIAIIGTYRVMVAVFRPASFPIAHARPTDRFAHTALRLEGRPEQRIPGRDVLIGAHFFWRFVNRCAGGISTG
jgi:hypothetical protein